MFASAGMEERCFDRGQMKFHIMITTRRRIGSRTIDHRGSHRIVVPSNPGDKDPSSDSCVAQVARHFGTQTLITPREFS